MEEITIQRINEGDSGAVAAVKIYRNDAGLRSAIRSLSDYLDAYGDLVSIVVSGGTISLEQSSGYTASSVMSQKAVTDFVNEKAENICRVGQTIETTVLMPDICDETDIWAKMASSNAQGHSLTVLYDDVEKLKNNEEGTALYDVIAEMRAQIESLNERVTALEEENNG